MLIRSISRRPLIPLKVFSRAMATAPETIHFGPFEVTRQVFLTTPHSFAVVNLKPLLPGHVLVCPLIRHKRLTDLSGPEVTDLFQTVQRVQRLLASYYFRPLPEAPPDTDAASGTTANANGNTNSTTTTTRGADGAAPKRLPAPPEEGSFNIAVQDGAEAGQTVAHVHVHVIPRIRDVNAKDPTGEGDALYDRMASEEGNVGGALWDGVASGQRRPVAGGAFPRIEDASRGARSLEDMIAEVEEYQREMSAMGI